MDKRAVIFIVKFIVFVLVFTFVSFAFCYIFEYLSSLRKEELEAINQSDRIKTVIIDPGHGGIDGGATGINGCIEKEINLKISLILTELLRVSNVNVVMTRETDIMLNETNVKGTKKIQDLKKRVEIAESYDNSVLVSIHTNTFSAEKYNGLQVYYSPNESTSKTLADSIQNLTKQYLQPNNARETKPATSSIYVLYNTSRPAVMVECGFISNQMEAELLSNDRYQHKLAGVIYAAIMDYLNKA